MTHSNPVRGCLIGLAASLAIWLVIIAIAVLRFLLHPHDSPPLAA